MALPRVLDGLSWRRTAWTVALSALVAAALDRRTRGERARCVIAQNPTAATRGLGFQVPYAARIRREADIPVQAVGFIVEPAQAEAVLQDGEARASVRHSGNWIASLRTSISACLSLC